METTVLHETILASNEHDEIVQVFFDWIYFNIKSNFHQSKDFAFNTEMIFGAEEEKYLNNYPHNFTERIMELAHITF